MALRLAHYEGRGEVTTEDGIQTRNPIGILLVQPRDLELHELEDLNIRARLGVAGELIHHDGDDLAIIGVGGGFHGLIQGVCRPFTMTILCEFQAFVQSVGLGCLGFDRRDTCGAQSMASFRMGSWKRLPEV